MLALIGCLIVVIAVVLLVKQYEARMILLGAGFLMGAVSGDILEPLNAFYQRMTNAGLMEPILSVAGFALVMHTTKCDLHLIRALTKTLRFGKMFLVPGAAILTFLINIALPSAAGAAAAVGAVFIPLLISMGVRPAMAASAVMMGTFGSLLSPGLMHNPFVAKMADMNVMDLIAANYWPVVAAELIGAISLGIYAIVTKEYTGYVAEDNAELEDPNFKVNPVYAIVPVLPLTLLILGASELADTLPWLKSVRVSYAMLFGCLVGIVVTRTNPATATKDFFRGMGDSYALVMGIIISAGVFVGGMDACGIIDAGNAALRESTDLVKYASAWGPFLLTVVTGSGDAVTLAFNEAVTPHAATFGYSISQMGSMAAIAGALGRTMSPLTGACIICAGIAKINPLEIAKRNAIGMIIACGVCMFMIM